MTASACTPFDQYTAELAASLETQSEVLGLVLLGSTADASRVDEWSDHDFFVVTTDGAQEHLRADLSWLPHANNLVLTVRETEHGIKAFYDDGHVLEFAVFSLGELELAEANSWAVALDRADVAERMSAIAARPKASAAVDVARGIRLFVSLLLIGVGRARRGETITAGQFVRSHALSNLLSVLAHTASGDTGRLDSLDPFRRFEFAFPALGTEIAQALDAAPEAAAHTLLAIAERELAERADWPTEAVRAVRERLGWAR